jgi:hypothetical protein
LVVNKFSVHPPLGENKKHKTNAQNKKLLGIHTTTTLSPANAQNKILFSTYTTTLSQANAQGIKSLSKELCETLFYTCSWMSSIYQNKVEGKLAFGGDYVLLV